MSPVRNLVLQDSKKGISNGVRRPLVFVISGPSGSGKTTLVRKFLNLPDFKRNLIKSVSLTTRPPRKDERDRKDYHFLKKEEFILKRKNKEILEWTQYLGHFYGTEKKTLDGLLEKRKDVLLCLDTRGALKIKKMYPENSILIFILPASFEVLKKRLEKRPPEKDFNLVKRLEKAGEEIKLAKEYDYRILNDRIGSALKRLKEIILKERRWATNL